MGASALPQSEEAALLSLAVNLLSILLDIIILSLYFPRKPRNTVDEFSAAMAVINLLVRGPSSLVLYRDWCRRGGGFEASSAVQVVEEELGGSVRSASVLSHYRGQYGGGVVHSDQTGGPVTSS